MQNYKFIQYLVAPVVTLSVIIAILHVWANTPVVYFSWSSGECVYIVDAQGEHGCNALESGVLVKYEREWVK